MINGFSTLKQAQDGLTEKLVKYLPDERMPLKAANVPMVVGVIDHLIKAGWQSSAE